MGCAIVNNRTFQGVSTVLLMCAAMMTAKAVCAQPVPPPASGNGGASAQQAADQIGSAASGTIQAPIHQIVRSIPEAATIEVPEWIAPGMRLTYLGGIGTVNDAAGAMKMVEDANGPFVDSNGKRFRQGDVIGTPTGDSWYHVIDVVAVEPGAVVLVNSAYHLGHGGVGTQSPLSSDSMLVHPSGCDYFLHPHLMSKIAPPTFNGMDVMRYTMNHDNGNQYQCVHFVVANTPEYRQSVAFDAASGVNLTYTNITRTTGQTAFKPVGSEMSPTSNSSQSLSIMRFISARTVELPWRAQTMPAWARTMKRARYEGAITFAGPAYVNLPDWRVLVTAEYTTKQVGQTFVAYDMTVTQQSPMAQPQVTAKKIPVVGPASIGGLWINPDALKALQQGKGYDADPTTGAQIGVEYIGRDNSGRQVVVIAMGNKVFKVTYVYDAGDGRLLSFTRQDYEQLTGNTQTMQLQLVGME